jgi:AAA15 family ATPase/GTPase
MRLKKVELINFKRFTNLTIDSIPESAKLVLLIGSNGSGKSSVFDGFELINSSVVIEEKSTDYDYYRKEKNIKTNVNILVAGNDKLNFDIVINEVNSLASAIIRKSINLNKTNLFYGRTSFRQLSRIKHKGSILNVENDLDRPKYFIDKDNRFEFDIERITQKILTDLFQTKKSTEEIKSSYINPVNFALNNIFGDNEKNKIELIEIIPPLDGQIAQINFKKGNSTLHYNFLSAGEKEIINIIFNLLARKDDFNDTVYFLDEIDLHLNTKLQYAFLKEITENWIPENCQLWTATHSLGFIQYAKDTEHSAIIDFDDLDFDIPQVLFPSSKDNFEIFEIAVDKNFLSEVFAGKKAYFSEGTDTPIYNSLNIKDTIFFKADIGKLEVFNKAIHLKLNGIIDRDYLDDSEVTEIENTYQNIKILKYYSIENYLFHPENLMEYYTNQHKDFNVENYIKLLFDEKNMKLVDISYGINKARDGYPFFKENDNAKKLKNFKDNGRSIIELLQSNEFETFYKVFPMKDYGKAIPDRQNLTKIELSKTQWFKNKITELLNK